MAYEVNISPVYQDEVDIDGGGRFSLTSALFELDIRRRLSAGTRAALKLKYAVHDYDFDAPVGLGGVGPWDEVSRFGVSVPLYSRVGNTWMLGIIPEIDWLREEGASTRRAESYGATMFAMKSVGRRKVVGLGAGLFREIDGDTEFFPLLVVDWRFDEHWRLANPFDAEALGPAGLELSYRFDERWRLGAGGVYRSRRFRLDSEGIAPDGIGEQSAQVAFIRLRRAYESGLKLDVYAGAMLQGELEVQDPKGRRIAASDYDSAPFAAVTVTAKF